VTAAPRADLLLEVDTTLDGSGEYIGDWIDTGGVLTALVTFQSNSSTGIFEVQQSMDQSFVFFDGNGPNLGGGGSSQEYPLRARYFRIKASGGTASATLRACVRAIG
jgi:type 1 fimbria pilin